METHFENEFPLRNQHETNEVLMFLLLFSTMATKWLPRAFEAILKWVLGVELKSSQRGGYELFRTAERQGF